MEVCAKIIPAARKKTCAGSVVELDLEHEAKFIALDERVNDPT